MSDSIWQLLYPKHGGGYDVLDLTDMIIMEQGRGIPPLHYITQRGTFQHGETAIDMRLDPRIIQVVLTGSSRNRSSLYSDLHELMRRMNPARNWAITGALSQCIYRKIMPGGRRQWRSDLITTTASASVYSATGRFVEWGLGAGDPFTIASGPDAGDYVISSVRNENMLELTQALAGAPVAVEYRVTTNRIIRDLYVLLESGLALADNLEQNDVAFNETLKLVANDPVWSSPVEQHTEWDVSNVSNLVFYESPDWTAEAVFPIWFGVNAIVATTSLIYLGTWPSRPLIRLDGPFTKAQIQNLSSGDQLTLVYAAGVGEQVTIDLNALTITNNYGSNLMRYMSTPYADVDSDLITFRLYPDPQVQEGINQMSMIIYGAALGQTHVAMYWHSRYVGV